MLMRPNLFVCRFLSAWTALVVVMAASWHGQQSYGQEAIPYDTFTTPQGESYVAVGLQGTQQVNPAPPEVVFLVDTAAGMIGQARQDTFAALNSAIDRLPDGAKIRIFSMDMETEALTPDFVFRGWDWGLYSRGLTHKDLIILSVRPCKLASVSISRLRHTYQQI